MCHTYRWRAKTITEKGKCWSQCWQFNYHTETNEKFSLLPFFPIYFSQISCLLILYSNCPYPKSSSKFICTKTTMLSGIDWLCFYLLRLRNIQGKIILPCLCLAYIIIKEMYHLQFIISSKAASKQRYLKPTMHPPNSK